MFTAIAFVGQDAVNAANEFAATRPNSVMIEDVQDIPLYVYNKRLPILIDGIADLHTFAKSERAANTLFIVAGDTSWQGENSVNTLFIDAGGYGKEQLEAYIEWLSFRGVHLGPYSCGKDGF